MSLLQTIIVRAGLWILLGLVGSLFTAWGCALAGRGEPSRALRSAPLNDGADDWSGSYGLAFGVEHYELFRLDDWMTTPPLESGQSGPRRLPEWACIGLRDPNIRQSSRFASGWPFRCLAAGMDSIYGQRTARRRWDSWGYIALGQTGRARIGDTDLAFDDKLPVRPIWRGLVFNTLIFTAGGYVIVKVVLALPQAVRCIVGIREGHCRSCKYDLRGVPREEDGGVRCPECGRVTEDA